VSTGTHPQPLLLKREGGVIRNPTWHEIIKKIPASFTGITFFLYKMSRRITYYGWDKDDSPQFSLAALGGELIHLCKRGIKLQNLTKVSKNNEKDFCHRIKSS
jgi:hypothetical protein